MSIQSKEFYSIGFYCVLGKWDVLFSKAITFQSKEFLIIKNIVKTNVRKYHVQNNLTSRWKSLYSMLLILERVPGNYNVFCNHWNK